eukprot:gene46963-57508_t
MERDLKSFAKMHANEVASLLETNVQEGLDLAQVSARIALHGPNKLEEGEKESLFMRYLKQFKEPLILLLLGSACLSLMVGQFEDAASIFFAVLLVGSVAAIQEFRSEQALEALQNLVPPKCTVLRGGRVYAVLAEELVPGDVVPHTEAHHVAWHQLIGNQSVQEADEGTSSVEARQSL